MKNLTLLFSIAILLASCGGKSEYFPTIEADVRQYNKDLNDHNYESAMNYLNPKIFDIVPKEMMQSSFDMMETMDIQSELLSVDSISKVIDVEGDMFTRVYYKNKTSMAIPPDAMANIDEFRSMMEQEESLDFNIDMETGKMDMTRDASMIAAKYADSDSWKYVDLNAQSASMFSSLFPSEVNETLLAD